MVSGHDERTPILAGVIDQRATTRTYHTIDYNDYLGDTILDILHISTLGAVNVDIADARGPLARDILRSRN